MLVAAGSLAGSAVESSTASESATSVAGNQKSRSLIKTRPKAISSTTKAITIRRRWRWSFSTTIGAGRAAISSRGMTSCSWVSCRSSCSNMRGPAFLARSGKGFARIVCPETGCKARKTVLKLTPLNRNAPRAAL